MKRKVTLITGVFALANGFPCVLQRVDTGDVPRHADAFVIALGQAQAQAQRSLPRGRPRADIVMPPRRGCASGECGDGDAVERCARISQVGLAGVCARSRDGARDGE